MSAAATGRDGAVRVFAGYDRDFTERAEVAVVGSGPAGAIAAYELACAGRDVLLLEEGPPFTPEDFVLDGAISMARTMREGGLRATRGHVLPTMQAIALGGGSLVNSAICVRPPEAVFEGWCANFELSRTRRADLDPHFEAVEKLLGIEPTPDAVQGLRNLVFRRGCDALGIPSEPIPRNVRGCHGSGECFTGCRARAKQSMDVSAIPDAIRHGARVLTSVQVREIRAEGRRVTGLAGRVVAPFSGAPGPAFRVEADAVVLAAGCMATPVLLQKSGGLADGSGQVGRNLQFHPGAAVMGVFDEDIDAVFGATQGYQSLHFLDRGFKLETLWAPPAVFAVRLPGMGASLKRRLAEIRRASIFDAIASCHRSLGTVKARRGASMDPILTWRFHPEDVQILGSSLWEMARILFAAGARKVLPGVHGVPDELHSLDEAQVLRDRTWRPQELVAAANHAFCSTRMHGDPRQGVVDEYGRCHDLDNLWITDTGIFPRSSGVNPMLTGMALSRRAALQVAEAVG
ncbi:MAG: GMC family oxidoreductase [Myxococcota bacterium]|nr:GMC family oxidoreductase [Myxococcota bacterium]